MRTARAARLTRSRPAALLAVGALLAGCGVQSDRQFGAHKHTQSNAKDATTTHRAVAPTPIEGATAGGQSTTPKPPPARTTTTEAVVPPETTLFAPASLRVPKIDAGTGIPARPQLTIPVGWTASVFARVPDARLEAWTPEGQLLVSEPSKGRVVELTPRVTHAGIPAERILVSGLSFPQGLAFGTVGHTAVLYIAETDKIDRYVWAGGTLGARKVIASGLPDSAPAGSDNHTLKNVVARYGRVDVDLGSGSNASPPAATDPPRASIVSYGANGGPPQVLATGVRNGDGLSFAPDGTLWTAVNERDQIPYPFHHAYGGSADAYGKVIRSYVNDHPPDELARITSHRNLGWPYCDPDPDVHTGIAGTPLTYANLPFTPDQQTNPGGRRLNCATLLPLQRGIPAHSAPLGFHFLEGSRLPLAWTQGALVATHGSWDRQPARSPGVLWLPWEQGADTLGAPLQLVAGFQAASGARWGRPVDAVPGPDGAIYISDDQAGAIYRLVPGHP